MGVIRYSGVVSNAHCINAGRPPILQRLVLYPCDDTDATASLTVNVACTRIAKRFGLDRADPQCARPRTSRRRRRDLSPSSHRWAIEREAAFDAAHADAALNQP